MQPTRLHIDPLLQSAPIDPRLFGAFVEHLGRCVYGGIYDPANPLSDSRGWRADVLDLVRELNPPVTRYPGGNFVSAYHWEDGIGPRPQRPRRLEPAWAAVETNEVGINEFVEWARKAGTQPFIAVNLGTRGVTDAVRLLEYCNHPGGTALSDLRASHGCARPHNIRLWCLGNEMDGPWQTGHKTAVEYGRLAAETARAMKQIDPALELVLCGSSHPRMPAFPEWDWTTLDLAFDEIDHISAHLYLSSADRTLEQFLGEYRRMDHQIRTLAGVCDAVAARRKSRKRVTIAFDEWNVWSTGVPKGEERWQVAPAQLEEVYTHADAVVAGLMLITLLQHSPRVRIACLAQLVNVIAPIVTPRDGSRAWKQSIFHPFADASRFGRGILLATPSAGPFEDHPEFGRTPWIEHAAVLNPKDETVTLFAVNRHTRRRLALEATLGAPYHILSHTVLHHRDPSAANSAAEPDSVAPRAAPASAGRCAARRLEATLPPVSWNVIRLRPA